MPDSAQTIPGSDPDSVGLTYFEHGWRFTKSANIAKKKATVKCNLLKQIITGSLAIRTTGSQSYGAIGICEAKSPYVESNKFETGMKVQLDFDIAGPLAVLDGKDGVITGGPYNPSKEVVKGRLAAETKALQERKKAICKKYDAQVKALMQSRKTSRRVLQRAPGLLDEVPVAFKSVEDLEDAKHKELDEETKKFQTIAEELEQKQLEAATEVVYSVKVGKSQVSSKVPAENLKLRTEEYKQADDTNIETTFTCDVGKAKVVPVRIPIIITGSALYPPDTKYMLTWRPAPALKKSEMAFRYHRFNTSDGVSFEFKLPHDGEVVSISPAHNLTGKKATRAPMMESSQVENALEMLNIVSGDTIDGMDDTQAALKVFNACNPDDPMDGTGLSGSSSSSSGAAASSSSSGAVGSGNGKAVAAAPPGLLDLRNCLLRKADYSDSEEGTPSSKHRKDETPKGATKGSAVSLDSAIGKDNTISEAALNKVIEGPTSTSAGSSSSSSSSGSDGTSKQGKKGGGKQGGKAKGGGKEKARVVVKMELQD
eukprot:g15777.t1